jgi:hypothetical protein
MVGESGIQARKGKTLNPSPEVPRVEGYINPGKRDGSKSTLELDKTFSFLLLLSLLKTRFDDVADSKHFLHFFNTESLSQL